MSAADHRPESVPPEALGREHEQRDLSTRSLFVALGVLAAGTALAVWLMAMLFGALQSRAGAQGRPSSPLVEEVVPPTPRLETVTGSLVERQRRAEDNVLTGYAWVDRQTGVVRIPVERAIEVLAERGLPTRGAAAQDESAAAAGSDPSEAQ